MFIIVKVISYFNIKRQHIHLFLLKVLLNKRVGSEIKKKVESKIKNTVESKIINKRNEEGMGKAVIGQSNVKFV